MLAWIAEVYMWAFLKDEANQRVLIMLGGVIAFLWTAGFGVYVYRNPHVPAEGHRHAGINPPQTTPSVGNIGASRFLTWAVGLLVLGGVQYGWKLYAEATAPKVGTYYLCMGSYQQNCAPTEWVPCHSDMSAHVKAKHPDVCIYMKASKLSDVSGNECGYATYKFDCSTKE